MRARRARRILPGQTRAGPHRTRTSARAREGCCHNLMRAKHLLSKFPLGKGVVYPERSAWTKAHREWLGRLEFADHSGRLVFEGCLEGVRSLELRGGGRDK